MELTVADVASRSTDYRELLGAGGVHCPIGHRGGSAHIECTFSVLNNLMLAAACAELIFLKLGSDCALAVKRLHVGGLCPHTLAEVLLGSLSMLGVNPSAASAKS